jgi:hypothetical protein
MELKVDLRYVNVLLTIIAVLIGIVGYFLRKEIANFGKRIDKHDEILFIMTGNVQKLIGYYEGNNDRRVEQRPPSSSAERRRNR